jgi:hypothetical protein
VEGGMKLIISVCLFVGLGIILFAQGSAPANEFKFSLGKNGVTITRYKGASTRVVIPAVIDEKPVTTIGEAAFRECSGLTSLSYIQRSSSIILMHNLSYHFKDNALLSKDFGQYGRWLITNAITHLMHREKIVRE